MVNSDKKIKTIDLDNGIKATIWESSGGGEYIVFHKRAMYLFELPCKAVAENKVEISLKQK